MCANGKVNQLKQMWSISQTRPLGSRPSLVVGADYDKSSGRLEDRGYKTIPDRLCSKLFTRSLIFTGN